MEDQKANPNRDSRIKAIQNHATKKNKHIDTNPNKTILGSKNDANKWLIPKNQVDENSCNNFFIDKPRRNIENSDEFANWSSPRRPLARNNTVEHNELELKNRYTNLYIDNSHIVEDDSDNSPGIHLTDQTYRSQKEKRPQVVVNQRHENQRDFKTDNTYLNVENHSQTHYRNRRKKITIFSDSIAKSMRMKELNANIDRSIGTANLKAFPGATIRQLNHYTIPTLEEDTPETAIIHVGINNLLLEKNKADVNEIAENIVKIGIRCKENNVKNILISGILYTTRVNVNIVRNVNRRIEESCIENGFIFINNEQIQKIHLWKDGIHLINAGLNLLSYNFTHSLNRLNKDFLGNGSSFQAVT